MSGTIHTRPRAFVPITINEDALDELVALTDDGHKHKGLAPVKPPAKAKKKSLKGVAAMNKAKKNLRAGPPVAKHS